MTASLNPKVLADLNTAFAEHFDGIKPITGLSGKFGMAGNLQSVAEQLSYTGPSTPQF
jgi:hypothetical protein